MKFTREVFGICVFASYMMGAVAFLIQTTPTKTSASPLQAIPFELVPDMPLQRLDGGNTVRTFQMPPGVERCQLYFTTEGRPLKAKVELWCGPLRTTHTMVIDSEDGIKFPFRAVLKFKKMYPPQVVKVSTFDPEFPMYAGVMPAGKERNKAIAAYTDAVWENSVKTKVQGGNIKPKGGGAVRTWSFDASVKSVQLVIWSFYVGKKSFNLKVQVLQGPNNTPQEFDLKCGGGSQPYHFICEMPGGGTIRIVNNKFVEDGLTEVVAVPFEYSDDEGPGDVVVDNFADVRQLRSDPRYPTIIPQVLTPQTAWPQGLTAPPPGPPQAMSPPQLPSRPVYPPN
ncbi:hypothetical protein FisN_14Hh324 [Fistulifera solaris]|jgi:hypothetical protein|uniref:Uncharacterized protein n=1 Tax=Fistulifera solaris TaxID=1519565 RepID=A0A1Z5KB43_FISSO|nr:hypothetical protein FisN_14Hh324 [Fistulifera solaris]|eukprot:GAX23503.1 hypothetical protein FisN_14Hh324 [Fistulifera solaris]